MNYSVDEVIQYIEEEDVKFIRLSFCDVLGHQKNIAIMPRVMRKAFEFGIAIDASAITGFGSEVHSDLLLHPDPSTLCCLPWRPDTGRVVRMFCTIARPDGTVFESDTRSLLIKAAEEAEKAGVSIEFGSELEFYLFETDEKGNPTKIPYDNAGYMDIAPEDKGENVRREICLTLDQMDIEPESSHHEEGPGQNEIDFMYSSALSAADNAITFQSVVRAIAARNGLTADFSPKPIKGKPGSGFHINISVNHKSRRELLNHIIAGIMDKIREITLFLNPVEASYERFGSNKAPTYITWSEENRSQLIRIPATPEDAVRAELRSPDPMANPYVAFTLLIYAGLYGIKEALPLPDSTDINLFTAPEEELKKFSRLPGTLAEAREIARNSSFVREHLPEGVINAY